VRDDLLRAKRERRGIRRGQRERLVERIRVKRLRPPSTAAIAWGAVRTSLL
jgi:hypothetical protein